MESNTTPNQRFIYKVTNIGTIFLVICLALLAIFL